MARIDWDSEAEKVNSGCVDLIKSTPKKDRPTSIMALANAIGVRDDILRGLRKRNVQIKELSNAAMNPSKYSLSAQTRRRRCAKNPEIEALNKKRREELDFAYKVLSGTINISDSLKLVPMDPILLRCRNTHLHDGVGECEWKMQRRGSGRVWMDQGFLCNACKRSFCRRYQETCEELAS